ncbi:hypothetical protein TO66_23655 [Pseudomonas sp. MRSN 12121]|nr:hypothetical protein TO66_23655 [Pseudomonas sp. MRSN 12121]
MAFLYCLLVQLGNLAPISRAFSAKGPSLLKPLIGLLIKRRSSIFFMDTFEIVRHGEATAA